METIKQPLIIPIPGEEYMLVEDYTHEWWAEGALWRINIKQGFQYDGASVPRFAWTITGYLPDGLQRAAALVHDFIYRHAGTLPKGSFQMWSPHQQQWVDLDDERAWSWSRKEADRLFGRMMREAGVPKWRRRLAFRFVQLLGWAKW